MSTYRFLGIMSLGRALDPSGTVVVVHATKLVSEGYLYRIAGKFGEDFGESKTSANLISPIIKPDVFRNTHAHNSFST